MEYFVYIIYSGKLDRYYIGHSQNVRERLERHNGGRSKYTKMVKDWEVKWQQVFTTRAEAMAREREIKGKKSRGYIEYLIRNDFG
nr:GIY-YIG nuclease family protein [Allomuricauda sp.]